MRHLFSLQLFISILTVLISTTVFAQSTTEEEAISKWEYNTCYECHDSEMERFKSSSHHLIISKTEGISEEESCDLCHGNPEAHNEEPDLQNILTGHLNPIEISEKCISCHQNSSRSSLLSVNDHSDLQITNCISCHGSGHYEEKASPLLLNSPQKLCSECHQSERAQFEMPFAHKGIDGPMSCTACHSIHDQNELFSILNDGANRLCAKCHEEKSGPYLFPHAVNEIEACNACHTPHGSTTPFLLTRPNSTQLCMECHTDFFIIHREPTLGLQSCVQCHAEIHGSQRDHLLFQP